MMKKQTGFLNILTVGIVIIMGLLSAALVNMVISSTNASINIQAGNQAYDLANAAVEVGLYNLAQTPSVCNSPSAATLGPGEYQYSCASYLQTTTLSGPITAGATSLKLTSVTGFAPVGYVGIEREIIYYDSVDTTNLTLNGLRRGMQVATPGTGVAHLNGVIVSQNQYVVTGTGGVPTIASPSGLRTIKRAALRTGNLYAGDLLGVIYSYNGTSWTQTTSVTTANQINGISCSANENCWAVGNGGKFNFYNGTKGLAWTESTIGALAVNAVSCSDSSHCLAAGDRAAGATAAGTGYICSGGPPCSWVSVSVTRSGSGTGNGNFNTLSCGALNNCSAGNSATDMYRYTGSGTGNWGSGVNYGTTINEVSCADATHCEGVGLNGASFHFNGTNWVTPLTTVPGGLGSDDFTTISCPTATYCVASSPRPSTYTYNGTSWSSRIASGVNNLSCLAVSNCVGGGTNGQFSFFNGTTWTPTQKPTDKAIMAISKPIAGTVTPKVIPINVQS